MIKISKDRLNRSKIFIMHIDCDELVEKAKLKGFNVVEVEKC